MDDLRERLEAALSEAQFQAQHLANDATRTARWEAHTATLREALDHPERLMGEPVGWQSKDFGDSWINFYKERDAKEYAEATGSITRALYAPPEVKP